MINKEAIRFFRYSGKPRIQMDFLRDNGQVLMQVYSYNEVKFWRPSLDFGDESGYILELYFYKSKTDNDVNYKRFCFSESYSRFKTFEDIKPKGAQFSFLNSKISNDYFAEFITELLRSIYGDIHIECHVHGPR
ncbi:MAG: hypothetical protein QNK23_02550 [Crocinitomicaceae bacterium]|nr:hypothetical protein [Crocinitomicaceae bacterium]